jgi:hypothetical protein
MRNMTGFLKPCKFLFVKNEIVIGIGRNHL